MTETTLNAPSLSRRGLLKVGLLKMGYSSLLQLVMLAWYGQPESWGHCGYPGPPKV